MPTSQVPCSQAGFGHASSMRETPTKLTLYTSQAVSRPPGVSANNACDAHDAHSACLLRSLMVQVWPSRWHCCCFCCSSSINFSGHHPSQTFQRSVQPVNQSAQPTKQPTKPATLSVNQVTIQPTNRSASGPYTELHLQRLYRHPTMCTWNWTVFACQHGCPVYQNCKKVSPSRIEPYGRTNPRCPDLEDKGLRTPKLCCSKECCMRNVDIYFREWYALTKANGYRSSQESRAKGIKCREKAGHYCIYGMLSHGTLRLRAINWTHNTNTITKDPMLGPVGEYLW